MTVTLVWDVVKWVLVVLAAGFIGQFGRVLALRLIERHRAKKAHDHSDLPAEVLLEKERLRATEKIEKKQAKAEVKKKKKEGG
ncbi:MAG: hypothetical protein U9N00_00285 [Candidatus Bipolaricaulota bacterium]|nr:hypothetical protein [Candidatus Bipolaricaulota bacterium]